MSKRTLKHFMTEEYRKQEIENEIYEQPKKKLRSQNYSVKKCRIISFYAEKGMMLLKKWLILIQIK